MENGGKDGRIFLQIMTKDFPPSFSRSSQVMSENNFSLYLFKILKRELSSYLLDFCYFFFLIKNQRCFKNENIL